MACNVETFAYPAWWSGASTVQISYVSGGFTTVNRADVEFLPQGVSTAAGLLVPWANVKDVQLV
ncbi:hypothetical protein AB0N31_10635 [Streptomyces sp. NPDC051051]|uniref:hypothetical protein n=1 Tax=Streptomyces sp. NPDC051051 TaxID=3155666 RepID=UPI0034304342